MSNLNLFFENILVNILLFIRYIIQLFEYIVNLLIPNSKLNHLSPYYIDQLNLYYKSINNIRFNKADRYSCFLPPLYLNNEYNDKAFKDTLSQIFKNLRDIENIKDSYVIFQFKLFYYTNSNRELTYLMKDYYIDRFFLYNDDNINITNDLTLADIKYINPFTVKYLSAGYDLGIIFTYGIFNVLDDEKSINFIIPRLVNSIRDNSKPESGEYIDTHQAISLILHKIPKNEDKIQIIL